MRRFLVVGLVAWIAWELGHAIGKGLTVVGVVLFTLIIAGASVWIISRSRC